MPASRLTRQRAGIGADLIAANRPDYLAAASGAVLRFIRLLIQDGQTSPEIHRFLRIVPVLLHTPSHPRQYLGHHLVIDRPKRAATSSTVMRSSPCVPINTPHRLAHAGVVTSSMV
jgi:hypothetical protein